MSAAVATPHQVPDLAFHLGSGGGVVGTPGGVGLGGAGRIALRDMTEVGHAHRSPALPLWVDLDVRAAEVARFRRKIVAGGV